MSDNDLSDFVTAVSGDSQLSIEENLGCGFVRLRVAEAERRQARHDIRCVEDIVIEMLRNARDAHAKTIYLASTREGSTRTLSVIDDGDGVPEDLRELIFEPRVTSKLESMVMDRWGVHGRGMALYSIKSNTVSSRIEASGEGLGSAFSVEVDLEDLPERTDQSTAPTLCKDEDGNLQVESGPHNVIRTTVEFALESKGDVTVYYGTPTDIVAAMVKVGKGQISDMQLLFTDDVEELPICLRPAAAADALELMKVASSLGLGISERTAHRILAGEIEPAEPPLERLTPSSRNQENPVDLYKDNRGLKIAPEDLDTFSRSLEQSFDTIAQRYYLKLNDKPKIRVSKNCITVRFPLDKEL